MYCSGMRKFALILGTLSLCALLAVAIWVSQSKRKASTLESGFVRFGFGSIGINSSTFTTNTVKVGADILNPIRGVELEIIHRHPSTANRRIPKIHKFSLLQGYHESEATRTRRSKSLEETRWLVRSEILKTTDSHLQLEIVQDSNNKRTWRLNSQVRTKSLSRRCQ